VLVLGVGNVTNEGNLDLAGATTRHLTPREFDGIAEEGDLLVVKSSGSAASIRSGKAAICAPDLAGKIACSNFMIRLTVDREKADPFLLWLLLNSPAARKFIRGIVGASTYPNIKWCDYRNFALPLPPLLDQSRMAKQLRQQLAAASEARAAM
jgi:restriction endonuclease S subunit